MSASKHVAQIAVVVAAHLVLLSALLAYRPARQAMLQIIPVVASIVPSERAETTSPPASVHKVAPKARQAPAHKQRPAAPKTTPIIAAESPPAMTAAMVAAPAPPENSAPTAAAPAPSSATSQSAAQATWTPPRADAAYLNNPKPEYPAVSLRLGETGRVVLNVLVSATGAAEQVNVHTSSGSERLDQAAVKAVKKWKFIPARRGDEAVAAQVLVPITFKTESE
ncbi:MAG: TonB family protein [Burkholderiales bacterium]|nr:TonB family protein [Burkholderiales bacterium]